jgi:hypothetical protein
MTGDAFAEVVAQHLLRGGHRRIVDRAGPELEAGLAPGARAEKHASEKQEAGFVH